LCPYLFHLYKEQQLLTGMEEKTWRAQETLLKYGEFGTDKEADSEPGSDPETEGEEDDDVPLPPFKRRKTTPPHKRGTPSGRDEPVPEGVPATVRSIPEEEETDPTDPFDNLITILSNVRADWEVKRRILASIGKLVDASADNKLVDKVAECITNPDESRKQEAEIFRLQEEVDLLKAKMFAFQEDMTATREMAEEARKVSEQVQATFGETGLAITKAKLFDKKMHEEKKLSRS